MQVVCEAEHTHLYSFMHSTESSSWHSVCERDISSPSYMRMQPSCVPTATYYSNTPNMQRTCCPSGTATPHGWEPFTDRLMDDSWRHMWGRRGETISKLKHNSARVIRSALRGQSVADSPPCPLPSGKRPMPRQHGVRWDCHLV